MQSTMQSTDMWLFPSVFDPSGTAGGRLEPRPLGYAADGGLAPREDQSLDRLFPQPVKQVEIVHWAKVISEAEERIEREEDATPFTALACILCLLWALIPVVSQLLWLPVGAGCAEEPEDMEPIVNIASVRSWGANGNTSAGVADPDAVPEFTFATNFTTGCTVQGHSKVDLLVTLGLMLAIKVFFGMDWSKPVYSAVLDRRYGNLVVDQEESAKGGADSGATLEVLYADAARDRRGRARQIRRGDRIVEVNGVRGDPLKILGEIRENPVLELELQGSSGLYRLPVWLSGLAQSAFRRPNCCSGFLEQLLAVLSMWNFVVVAFFVVGWHIWPRFAQDPLEVTRNATGALLLVLPGSNFTEFNSTFCQAFKSHAEVRHMARLYYGGVSMALFMLGALFMCLGEVMKLKWGQEFLLHRQVNIGWFHDQTSALIATDFSVEMQRFYLAKSNELVGFVDVEETPVETVIESLAELGAGVEDQIHKEDFLKAVWPFLLQAFGLALWLPVDYVRIEGCLGFGDEVFRRPLVHGLLGSLGIEEGKGTLEALQQAGLLFTALVCLVGLVIPFLRRFAPSIFGDWMAVYTILPLLAILSLASMDWPLPVEGLFFGPAGNSTAGNSTSLEPDQNGTAAAVRVLADVAGLLDGNGKITTNPPWGPVVRLANLTTPAPWTVTVPSVISIEKDHKNRFGNMTTNYTNVTGHVSVESLTTPLEIIGSFLAWLLEVIWALDKVWWSTRILFLGYFLETMFRLAIWRGGIRSSVNVREVDRVKRLVQRFADRRIDPFVKEDGPERESAVYFSLMVERMMGVRTRAERVEFPRGMIEVFPAFNHLTEDDDEDGESDSYEDKL